MYSSMINPSYIPQNISAPTQLSRTGVDPSEVILLEPEDFFEASEEHSFQNYTPVHFHQGLPHPDQLVQSASLSAVDPPPIDYELSLPEKVWIY